MQLLLTEGLHAASLDVATACPADHKHGAGARWARSSALPRWSLLVDDDSFVNAPHLLAYASRFDEDAPLLIGHVLDGVFAAGPPAGGTAAARRPRAMRSLSGGAGMLVSRAALVRFGCALATGAMPLPSPRERVPNDRHIAHWAGRLGVRCLHSNLFAYAALPADARLVAAAARPHARPILSLIHKYQPTRRVIL